MIMSDKAQTKEIYKQAKDKYLQTGSQEDWISFCEARRNCMLLGIRI